MGTKEMRTMLGFTQTEFAARYNTPKRTIEDWERGIRTPPQYVLDLLERCVSEDAENITRGTNKDNKSRFPDMEQEREVLTVKKSYPPVDRRDRDFALMIDPQHKWLESYTLNSKCANLLDQAIREPGYDRELLKEALDLYGEERVSYVLITAIFSLSPFDKNISADNSDWAYHTEHCFIPTVIQTEDYMLKAREDPAKLDGFITLYRGIIDAERPFIKNDGQSDKTTDRSVNTKAESDDGFFAIYQIDQDGSIARYQYCNLELMHKYGYFPHGDCYNLIYYGTLDKTDRSDAEVLELIYTRFNTELPADYYGHSLSVSDVVIINRGKEAKAYFVDSIGFKEVPDFVQERRKLVNQSREKKISSTESIGSNHKILDSIEENEPTKRFGR